MLAEARVDSESPLLPYTDERLTYDFLTHGLEVNKRLVRLGEVTDFLLACLLIRAGKVVTYEALNRSRSTYLHLREVNSNALNVNIMHLREMLDPPETRVKNSCIQTVLRAGYKYIPLSPKVVDLSR